MSTSNKEKQKSETISLKKNKLSALFFSSPHADWLYSTLENYYGLVRVSSLTEICMNSGRESSSGILLINNLFENNYYIW